MSDVPDVSGDTMECPLCLGKGQLKRIDALARLGMTDQDRVARLGAEEAFRLLINKQKGDEHWFELELEKRTKDATACLQTELDKLVRSGKREEIEFADEACAWPGIHLGDKLGKNGDYILSYRDPSGAARDPRLLVDNKDKTRIDDDDIDKLVRDAKIRQIQVGAVVTREEKQLRKIDED